MGLYYSCVNYDYPARMRKGYGSRRVCVSVCVSVTALAATYLVYKSRIRCYEVPWGVLNVCIVWVSLKMLSSFGVICLQRLPFMLWCSSSDETSMERMNNSGLFLWGAICVKTHYWRTYRKHWGFTKVVDIYANRSGDWCKSQKTFRYAVGIYESRGHLRKSHW